MKCTNCGREFEGTFCPDCGTKAAAQDRCPVCGAQHTEDEQFCPNCGYSFTGTSAQANKERRKRPKKPALLLPLSSIVPIVCGIAVIFSLFSFFVSPPTPLVLSDFFITLLGLIGCVGIATICALILNSYTLSFAKLRAHRFERIAKRSPDKTVKPEKFFRNRLIAFILIEAFSITMCVLFILFAVDDRVTPASLGMGCTVMILIPLLTGAAYCIWWKLHAKDIRAAYYASEDGSVGPVPTATYAALAQATYEYCGECVNFWRELFRLETKPADSMAGDLNTPARTALQVIAYILVSIFVPLTLLPIGAAASHAAHNMFYIEKVNAVDIGDSYETVEELLPDPYARDAGTQTWTYYDNNFKKLLEKNENFDPSEIQDWDDFEDAFNDAAELETTQFGYIEVHFERESGNSGTYIVSSVFFDPARQYRDGYEHREAESYEALDISVDEETDAVTVIYSATYEDGSFYKGKAAGTIERGSIASGRTITLSWRDYFGNACEAEYTIPAQS